METKVYQIEFAGRKYRYAFHYPLTRYQFRPLPRLSDGERIDVRATPEQIEKTRSVLAPDASDAFVEFRSLIGPTARALLGDDGCIFHSVSFLWREKAFLLAAPSGTGKTTQYMNWQRLFPGEIAMISGDMPVLELRDDGSVWAHPSPWNGKEAIGNRICAPVSGVVLLEQGEENAVSSVSAHDAILPFFSQFVVRPETEEQILALARLMDQILRTIPCYKLVNRGDDASTTLLRETLAPLAEGGDRNAL